MSNRLFFQDFLFENIPVDKNEYPDIEVNYCDTYDANSTIEVSLDKLLRISTEKEWDSLVERLRDKDVIIVDDVEIKNIEVLAYKKFYLDTYYYNISNVCNACKVFSNI